MIVKTNGVTCSLLGPHLPVHVHNVGLQLQPDRGRHLCLPLTQISVCVVLLSNILHYPGLDVVSAAADWTLPANLGTTTHLLDTELLVVGTGSINIL